MAETSWPFDNEDTSETQFSEMFRRLVSTGVWGGTTDDELLAYATSSGLNVKVHSGFAFVRGFMYSNDDDNFTLAIAAGGSAVRTDIVALRLDPAANGISMVIIQGVAGAGLPAVVQTSAGIYELPLAQVQVPISASTIASSNVTDVRTFSSLNYDVWETTGRPANPRLGQPGFNIDLGYPEYYSGGSGWKTFVPSSIDAGVITSGTLNAARIPGLDASKIVSGTISSARLPTVPVASGGTGSTDAAGARTNLGVPAISHQHSGADISSGTVSSTFLPTVPISKGGTGGTDAQTARVNLGLPPRIFVQQGDPGAGGQPDGTLWFPW